jgi:hypothetical protein
MNRIAEKEQRVPARDSARQFVAVGVRVDLRTPILSLRNESRFVALQTWLAVFVTKSGSHVRLDIVG